MKNFASYRFTCQLCKQPIQLQEAVTDGQGRPVHTRCYADALRRELRELDEPPPPGHAALCFA